MRMDAGDLAGAMRQNDELIEAAEREGNRPHELRARLSRARVSYTVDSTVTGEDLKALAEESLELFTALEDDAGLSDTWAVSLLVEHGALRWRGAKHALDRMVEYAERVGDRLRVVEAQSFLPAIYMYGPLPVEEGIAWCKSHPSEHPFFFTLWGQLEAMHGNFAGARDLCREARERARERGQLLLAAEVAMQETELELLAGEPERASKAALAGVAELGELGEQGWLSTVAGHGAEALYRLGRDEDAWRLTETAAEAGAADDVITQMLILQVRAKILSRRGEHGEAVRLVREAIAWGEPTDALEHKAASYCDLAIVLGAAGSPDEAREALDRARAFYEEKGHTVGMARVEEMRSELAASLGA